MVFNSGSGSGSGVRARGLFLFRGRFRGRSWLVGTALGGALAACDGGEDMAASSMTTSMPPDGGTNPSNTLAPTDGGMTPTESPTTPAMTPPDDGMSPTESPANTFSVATAPSSGTLQRATTEDVDFSEAFSTQPAAYSSTGLPSGLMLDPATGRLTGATEATGEHVVTLTATASDDQTAVTSFTLTLTDTNTAPVLAMPLEDFTLRQDAFVSVSLDLNTFVKDTDVTDTLRFRASGNLPEGLSFSGPNVIESELSSTPTDDSQANAAVAGTLSNQALEGSYTLTITVDDGSKDGVLIEKLVITIKAQGNTAPVLRSDALPLESSLKRGRLSTSRWTNFLWIRIMVPRP